MKKTITLTIFSFCLTLVALCAEPGRLSNFIIKESLLRNDKLAIIATDSNETPLEVSGRYQFNINGFKQDLRFNEGVAITPQPIEKSTFIYLKHINDSTSVTRLYYVWKKADSLTPIKINLKLLVLIPIAIVVLSGLFKRFLIYGIIILVAMFFFNSKNGLSFPTFFETLYEGLKSFFF
ncbi:hypothetical protein [Desertivirga brevis]|uniref:hypothetical protein n=1 Tax=Desertivirga brevis TaxID=2810310 RepID=UPI001A95EB49|nr:hypothetical protein [Pedobacter sp. SYSU D00873]